MSFFSRSQSKDGAAGKRSAKYTAPKVLLISHDAQFYGGQLLALHIVRSLREAGVEVVAILLGGGPLRPQFEAACEVVDFTDPPWRTRPSDAVNRNRRSELAALHRRGFRHAICNTTAAASLLPLLHGTGFHSTVLVHELPNILRQFSLEDVARSVALLSDRIVFPAAFVRDRFQQLAEVDPAKVVIRPQGLFRLNTHRDNREAARADLLACLGLAQDARIIVAAGPADRRKGVDIFCQVALQVARQAPQAKFIWIGDDRTELAEDCRAWLDCSGLVHPVYFVGVAEDPDLYARRMAAADLYLMTSREDPFPSVVLDALALGIPVVGFSEAGGFGELLDKGAGMLVPMLDRAAMAEAVLSLIRETTLAKTMGAAGRTLVEAELNFKDYVNDLLRVTGVPFDKQIDS